MKLKTKKIITSKLHFSNIPQVKGSNIHIKTEIRGNSGWTGNIHKALEKFIKFTANLGKYSQFF